MDLMPLKTLPGWPEAPHVSVPAMLLIYVGIPVVIFLFFFVLGKFPEWLRSNATHR